MKVIKIRTKNRKLKFDLDELYFSIFAESSFTARLRYIFAGFQSQTNLESAPPLPQLQLKQQNFKQQPDPSLHSQVYDFKLVEEASMFINENYTDGTWIEKIQRERREKMLELSHGSNFVERNKEQALQPIEQQRLQIKRRDSLRWREALRNKRIRDHDKQEKARFLSDKHDLVRSVSLLQRIYDHNNEQAQCKQQWWLQVLVLSQVCDQAFHHFIVSYLEFSLFLYST